MVKKKKILRCECQRTYPNPKLHVFDFFYLYKKNTDNQTKHCQSYEIYYPNEVVSCKMILKRPFNFYV